MDDEQQRFAEFQSMVARLLDIKSRVIGVENEQAGIRSRLQALEQNTTPARPAEQKPREWLILPRAARDSAECVIAGRSYDSTLINAGYIRVREVL